MQDAHRAARRDAVHFSRLALLTASVMIGASSIVSAQALFDPLRGYSLDGSPSAAARAAPPPRGRDAPVREDVSERQSPSYMSAGRIRRLAAQQGYRLDTAPHRRGHSIFAVAENESGHRFQLIFNAYTGAIVGQRDLGPIAIAKASPDSATPGAAAAPVPDSAEVVAARADAQKAAAAEADARRIVEARAAESRKAQAKLAEAEAVARRDAEAKLAETRRQEALALEQRRNEEHLAEVKRQTLTAAEAKLAQAKAAQAKAEAEIKQAEADAAKARAAVAPAQMAVTTQKPAEMAPSAKDAAGVSPTQASQEPSTAPAQATAEGPKQSERGTEVAKQVDAAAAKEALAKSEATQVPPVSRGETPPSQSSAMKQTPENAASDQAATASPSAVDATDVSPTGSTKPNTAPASSPATTSADKEHP